MKRWRDVYKIHPLAAILPRMDSEELKELAEDIKRNGLKHKIVLWQEGGAKDIYVVDGVSRLDAMESNGTIVWGTDGYLDPFLVDHNIYVPGLSTAPDFARLVISFNLHRRHLTAEQKVKLGKELLEAGKKWKWSESLPINTAASLMGVPVDDILRAQTLKEADPGTYERVRAGKAELEPTEIISPKLRRNPGRPKSEVSKVAELAGVHRDTARKYLKPAKKTPIPAKPAVSHDEKDAPELIQAAQLIVKYLIRIYGPDWSKYGTSTTKAATYRRRITKSMEHVTKILSGGLNERYSGVQ
jgi:hypothetical protein